MITPALVSGLTGVVGPKTGLTSRQTSSWTEVASGGYCSSCSSLNISLYGIDWKGLSGSVAWITSWSKGMRGGSVGVAYDSWEDVDRFPPD